MYKIVKSPYSGFDVIAIESDLYADVLSSHLVDGLPPFPGLGRSLRGDVIRNDDAEPTGPDEEGDGPLDGEVMPPDELPQALQLIRELSEIESRRIGFQEGRNQIAMRALDVNESSDQRQYQFHTERLAADGRDRVRSRELAKSILKYGGGPVGLLAALVIIMAFFGDSRQSEIATTMIEKGAEALGGAGFI